MFRFRHSYLRKATTRIGSQIFRKQPLKTSANQGNGIKSNKESLWRKRFFPAVAVGLIGGFGFGIYFNYNKRHRSVGLDSALPATYTSSVQLQPPTDSPPFPASISINREKFVILGTGVRSVTFLNFHVYAVGLYIAADDVDLARRIISRLCSTYNSSNDKQQWENILQDPTSGSEIVNTLCKENVRFAVRIVPTRNTDFNHLRDGFVRSITNHPEFKNLQTPEVGQSIGEIKRAFGRKRKLKKGEVVVWSRDVSGGMNAWYGDSDAEKELLGAPPHPDVARLFFLQYMTGAKPISPSLKGSVVKEMANLLT